MKRQASRMLAGLLAISLASAACGGAAPSAATSPGEALFTLRLKGGASVGVVAVVLPPAPGFGVILLLRPSTGAPADLALATAGGAATPLRRFATMATGVVVDWSAIDATAADRLTLSSPSQVAPLTFSAVQPLPGGSRGVAWGLTPAAGPTPPLTLMSGSLSKWAWILLGRAPPSALPGSGGRRLVVGTRHGPLAPAGIVDVGGGRFIACFPPVAPGQALTVDDVVNGRTIFSWPFANGG